jgi:hypothetical protein
MVNFTQAQTEIKQALDVYFGLYGSGDAMYASGNNLGSSRRAYPLAVRRMKH